MRAPMRVRQVGQVQYRRTDRPRRIRWADGYEDYVSLSDMPPAFASLKPGEWFEAVVLRDRLTDDLLEVLDIESISALRTMTASEQVEFLRSLPVGAMGDAE